MSEEDKAEDSPMTGVETTETQSTTTTNTTTTATATTTDTTTATTSTTATTTTTATTATTTTGTTPKKRIKREPSPMISDDEHVEPPAFSLATLGLQRVGTVPPPKPPKPPQPMQTLNARGMPARIRKKNRFFFDDDIINDDKPLRMSLSPRKTPIKAAAATTPTSQTHKSPARTPSKVLRHRKGVASRYMRAPENHKQELRTPTKLRHSSAESNSTNTTPKSASRLSSAAKRKKLDVEEYPTVAMDKNIAHRIGLKLRNLLKLPKAHKWVIYEWFYSFIDRPLFYGPNDFQLAMMESCSRLRARKMTRGDWRYVRRLIGKPRRCSPAFFKEERQELERRRQKLRFLQSRKAGEVRDLNYVRDLPDRIPLQLPIGTKVTARLRTPQDGVINGTVDAYDSLTSTYRVTFDRPGIGTHSVPDFEIISENFNESIPLQSITKDFRPSLMTLYANQNKNRERRNTNTSNNSCGGITVAQATARHARTILNMNLNKSDPLLGQEVVESPFKNPVLENENINGYPAKLLEVLVRLKRALAIKRTKLQRLSDMNNEAELKSSQQIPSSLLNNSNSSGDNELQRKSKETMPQLTEEFQRRYASIVISMEKMNKDMQDYLNDVQVMSGELTREPQVQAMLTPSYLREKCREAAEEAVDRNNQGVIKNKDTLKVIKNLSLLLLVASHLKSDDQGEEVNTVLEGCMEEVRGSLHPSNVETFHKQVQLRLQQIRLGIGQSLQALNENAAAEH